MNHIAAAFCKWAICHKSNLHSSAARKQNRENICVQARCKQTNSLHAVELQSKPQLPTNHPKASYPPYPVETERSDQIGKQQSFLPQPLKLAHSGYRAANCKNEGLVQASSGLQYLDWLAMTCADWKTAVAASVYSCSSYSSGSRTFRRLKPPRNLARLRLKAVVPSKVYLPQSYQGFSPVAT